MDHGGLSRRKLAQLFASFGLLGSGGTAWSICGTPREIGRWRNLHNGGDPMVLDLRMEDCGDQVLNGEQTQTRYSMKVWVRQSSGNYYGRPKVKATYRNWKGRQWLVARVPTGGYVDNIWAAAEDQNGKRVLRVLIKHESLDSKPSASSDHWFRYEKAI